MNGIRIAGTTAATVLLSAGHAMAAAAERPIAERLWYAQGLTHPIVVHFPIALLIAAAIAVVLKHVSRHVTNGLVYFCLLLGTGGAVLSCLAGWAWAPTKDSGYVDPFDTHSDIFWHRWGGIGITVACLAVLVWATVRLRRETVRLRTAGPADAGTAAVLPPPVSQRGWQWSVVAIAMTIGWVGHEGGELVYPGNFADMVAIANGSKDVVIKGHKMEKPDASQLVVQGATSSEVPGTRPTIGAATQTAGTIVATGGAATARVDFEKQVWPLFQERCIYCHGEEKAKGKLRMHTESDALKGGEAGPLYKPGNAAGSDLIKRVTTDDEDEVMPPPKEKKKLSPEQVQLLRQWINEGAKWPPPSAN